MNIKKTVTTIALATSIALGGVSATQTAFAGPESGATAQSGHGIRFDNKETPESRTELRGEGEWTEGEWMYLDYRGGNVLMVAIDDQGSDAAAKRYQRTLMTDEAMEYAGLYPMGDFRVTGTDNCEGMRGDMDGMTTYVVICYEDSYTAMIIGNNRRDVIDMAQEVEMYGEPETPRGYIEEEM